MFAVEVKYRPNGRGPWVTRLLQGRGGMTRTWSTLAEVQHYVSAVNAVGGTARVVAQEVESR